MDNGSVVKVVNMPCCYLEKSDATPSRSTCRTSRTTWPVDGAKMQGYNGSQLWDTTFAMQALAATRVAEARHDECLELAREYNDSTQVSDQNQQSRRLVWQAPTHQRVEGFTLTGTHTEA